VSCRPGLYRVGKKYTSRMSSLAAILCDVCSTVPVFVHRCTLVHVLGVLYVNCTVYSTRVHLSYVRALVLCAKRDVVYAEIRKIN
jgi:hypothetical protein